jgi:hypothetical protein
MAEFIDMQTFAHRRKAQLVAAVAACCLFAGLPLKAQEPAGKLQELETVVVFGGYATPQMWKVSKDGHVMWLLVIGAPVPAGVQWRSKQLEARVAESQLVLYASDGSGYSWSLSRSQRVAGQRARENAMRLPGKNTLKDVLPPETYAKWRVLKAAYIRSDDDIERLCPSCAMEELERSVMKTIPPPPRGPDLQPLVDKTARKYKVKVRTMPDVTRRVEFTQAELEMGRSESVLDMGDVKCFTQRLNYLERLIKYMDQQANATARDNAARPRSEYCSTDWLTSNKFTDPAAARSMSEKRTLQWKLVWQQVDAEWMAAAQAALAKNKSTVAVQRFRNGDLSHVSGYIAQFRELGYEVKEEPGSVAE